jgi:Zn-dependent metalloprotease
VDISLAYLQGRAADWGIRNAYEEFRLRRVMRDTLGQTHVRLDQVYQGVPVFGRQLIVHVDQNGAPLSATGAYLEGITVSTQAAISDQAARAVAQQRFPGPLASRPATDLMLYHQDGVVRLVYRVILHDDAMPRHIVAFVDANTGDLVDSYDGLRRLLPSPSSVVTRVPMLTPAPAWPAPSPTPGILADGVGHSLYSGDVLITTDLQNGTYVLFDTSRGGHYTTDMLNRLIGFWRGALITDADNIWGDNTTGDRASAAVDAYFGAAVTWDYYLNVHGRTGIGNDGVGTLSRVHYRRQYNNAFWSDGCQCTTYGDGDGTWFTPLVSLDIAGHELTHGVTSATAELIYANQSGGLNEAISDIFGTMVEFYAAAHGATKAPNYWIGEDVFTPGAPGDALRYMDNPTQDGRSIDTFADYADGMDVHYSSGIANNAFFLLAEGGAHRLGGVVTGIGRSAAEQIFYRALTVYMIPSETFSQARAHTTQAAIDLFGPGSQQVLSVGEAWSAVGVP